MCKAKPSVLAALWLTAMGDGAARAGQEAPPVPPSLRPWVAWVLDSEEAKRARCPPHVGESETVCVWPSRLALQIGERTGAFKQEWTIFKEGFVALPGNKEHWPRDVKVDGRAAPTVDHGGEAQVLLRVGRHTVTGSFTWDSLPESLMVPAETGLVSLVIKGKPVAFPMRERDGRVFLGKREEKVEEERVEISVYRKLSDTAPQLLTTRLVLAVSGKSRELLLAKALPDGFEPRAVDSGLPLRFENGGHVRMQARPGEWNVEILAHKVTAEPSIVRPVPDGLWKEGDEVWVFEAVPDLRAVTVTGPPAIDPAQTLLPAEWKSLPAYTLAPGAALTLVEQRRGDSDPPPERLTLARTLWLDQDGRGMSVHDVIDGQFTRSWRLEVGEGTRLGRVAVDANDQFITRARASGRDGVEIRSGRATVEADSRIENRGVVLPATSFVHDFDRLAAILNLPVGWDLLHAAGADHVSDSWVERWTFGQLLLLLVLVLAIGRLYGWRMGALALLTLGLTLVDSRAPAFLWVLVIASEAVARALGPGPVLVAARVTRVGLWLVLVLTTIPFALGGLRFAIYPASVADGAVPERQVSLLKKSGDSRMSSDSIPKSSYYAAYSVRPPAEERARNAGILGVLRAPERAPASIFGRDTVAGSDSSDVLGGLVANEIGEAYGVGGLGQVGTGTGGGGTGEGTIGLGGRHRGEQGKMGKGGPARRKEGLYGLKGPKDNPDPHLARKLAEAEPATKEGLYGLKADKPDPYLAKKLAEYDPSIVVQTGEGLPRRSWRSASLAWNGPVKSEQQLRLYLLPPWLGRILAVAQIGLLVLLGFLLVRRPLRLRKAFIPSRPLVTGLAALVLLLPLSASAQEFPPDDMLDELKEKLLKLPECAPDCAAICDMALDVAPAHLQVRLQVTAAMPTAIALPGDNSSWTPTEVRIGGKPASTLSRSSDGQLWLALVAGIFTVDLAGPLPGRDSIQIPLPMPPRRATYKARGFELGGIHEDGAVDESISLTRIASSTEGKSELSEAGPTLPPFLSVERTLRLGLRWEVETKVTRETAAGAPLVIEIPLLPGESVTTADIRAEKSHDKVSLSFAPGEQQKSWRSTLAERRVIDLRADPGTASRWTEIWRAQVSPIWHPTFAGIPPVRRDPGSAARVPEWRPWPGEEVHITVDKPGGAPGRTLTIDASTLDVELGPRHTQASLAMELRSSRGTDHRIALPAGAEVTQVTRDNVTQSIRREGPNLVLSIPAGKHNVSVLWRQAVAVSTFARAPAVDLRAPSINSTVNVRLVEKPRWILWLSGPSVGPVVGMWAVLAFVLVASVVLRRSRLTPLRLHQFVILGLGLGLSRGDPLASMLVVASLLALGWRARATPDAARPAVYDGLQVALVVLLAASLGVCINVIDLGLRWFPETFIMGNGPDGNQLSWFQDRAGMGLAQPSVLSVPIWVYRACVIAWTLWLAISVIRWSPWIWSCMKQHGLWRPLARPFVPPPTGV